MFSRVGLLLWAAGCVFSAMLFGGAEVFAQATPPNVTYTEIISFGNIFDTIRTTIAPLVAGAIGLGLAIWGASYLFKIVRGMGR